MRLVGGLGGVEPGWVGKKQHPTYTGFGATAMSQLLPLLRRRRARELDEQTAEAGLLPVLGGARDDWSVGGFVVLRDLSPNVLRTAVAEAAPSATAAAQLLTRAFVVAARADSAAAVEARGRG